MEKELEQPKIHKIKITVEVDGEVINTIQDIIEDGETFTYQVRNHQYGIER